MLDLVLCSFWHKHVCAQWSAFHWGLSLYTLLDTYMVQWISWEPPDFLCLCHSHHVNSHANHIFQGCINIAARRQLFPTKINSLPFQKVSKDFSHGVSFLLKMKIPIPDEILSAMDVFYVDSSKSDPKRQMIAVPLLKAVKEILRKIKVGNTRHLNLKLYFKTL